MAHILKTRVAETSTSTGTGDITLAGAVTAHRTFASVCSVADTTEYVIYAVDSSGVPTGEWEEGDGTYSASNTLTRTTPKSGSAATPVSFSAGTKVVIMTPLADRVGVVPKGGSTNYVLQKNSATDFDVSWGAAASGGSPGGSTTQVQYNSAGAFAGASGITTTGTELAIASGTQTTSKPVLDLSQTWNNGGVLFTGFKLNVTPTAYAGNSKLIDIQRAGATYFGVRENGTVLFGGSNFEFPNTTVVFSINGSWRWALSASTMKISSAAVLSWTNGDAGGTSTTGLAQNAAGVVEINNGTAGTYRDLKLRNLIASGGVVTLASFTVATLPSASTSGAGAQAFVTDANATTPRSTVAGGGSNKVNVFSDGTNWLIAA